MAGSCVLSWPTALASIASVLVDPVLTAVGDRSVVLTPSGVLAGVPWTLLPGFTGRPVTVAQSATSWLSRHVRRCGRLPPGSSPGRRWRARRRR